VVAPTTPANKTTPDSAKLKEQQAKEKQEQANKALK